MKGLGFVCLLVALGCFAGCKPQEPVPPPRPQVMVKLSSDAPFKIGAWASVVDRCSGEFLLSNFATAHVKIFEDARWGQGGSFVNLNLDRSADLAASAGGQLLQVSFKIDQVMSPGEMLVKAYADHAIIEFGGKRCRFPYAKGEPGARVVYDWVEAPHFPEKK